MKLLLPTAIFLFLAACGRAEPKAQLAPPNAAVPDALFVAADIPGFQPVAQVKKTAKPGDTVVVRGRVGGKEKPFVDGAAVLTLVDAGTVISCGAMKPPHIPWDYCCTPTEELAADSATLEVQGAGGTLVMAPLKGAHGLAEFHLLTVKGKVLSVDDKNLVLAPEAIFDAGWDGDGRKTGTPVRKVD